MSIPTPVRAAYATGSIATGLYSTVPGLLLMYYQTETLAVPPLLAGVALSLARLIDGVIDPYLGWLTDRTRSRWGRRHPWMLAGAVLLPLAFIALFSAPTTTPVASFAWVLVTCVLSALGFSMFAVPYIALAAELSDDPAAVRTLVGWRFACVAVGILAGGALAPALIEAFGGGRGGHHFMSVVLAGVMALTMAVCWLGTPSPPVDDAPPEPTSALTDALAALRHDAFRALLVSLVLQMIAIGLLLAGVPYYAQHVIGGGKGTVTALFVAMVLPAIALMPAWLAIARRVGSVRAYLGTLAALTAGAVGLGVLGAQATLTTALPMVVAIGAGYAGSHLFPFALLAITQQEVARTTGRAQTGAMTGVWTLGDQAALSAGALLAGAVLSASGFVEGGVAQDDGARQGIVLAMSWIPAALFAASLLWSQRLRALLPEDA